MRWSWSALQRVLWDERSQSFKLTLAVWLSLVPVFMLTSTVSLLKARQTVEGRLRQQLIWDAQQASEWLRFWNDQHLRQLQMLAGSHQIRSFQGEQAREVIDRAYRYFPHYSYAVLSKEGGTLDGVGSLIQPLDSQQLQRLPGNLADSYAKALKGISSSAPLLPPFAKEPCIASSVPVYRLNAAGSTVGGMMSTCISLQNLGWVTGINRLVKGVSGGDHAVPLMDLDAGKRRGYALLVVLEPGRLIELGLGDTEPQQGANQMRNLNVKHLSLSDWEPIVRVAESGQAPTAFHSVSIKGIDYLAGVDRSQPGRTVLMVVDTDTAYSTVNGLYVGIWVGILAALGVSSVVLARVTKEFARPFETVGAVLAQLSRGQFAPPCRSPKEMWGGCSAT